MKGLAAAAQEQQPIPGRKGTCRLCFDVDGGHDLIAPCTCRGTSKWIHRDCLNRWRTSGSNPRSLTNCCECGFQYQVELHRVMDSEPEQRRRRFMLRLAGQGIGCFFGTQLLIIAAGMIIRAIDKNEWLVRVFGFKQDPGQVDHVGNPQNAMQHHRTTYYVAGVLALLFILGVGTSFAGCLACCLKGSVDGSRVRSRETCCLECGRACCEPRLYFNPYGGFGYRPVCCDCAECCADSGRLCADGDCQCCPRGVGHALGDSSCPNIEFGGGGGANNPLVLILLVVVIVFVLVGLLAAIVALVASLQRAVAKLAQIQQMRVLAEEYVVRDLADPGDLGEEATSVAADAPVQAELMPPPPVPADAVQQQKLQMQINQDIGAIFGDIPVHPSEGLRSQPYGSMA